MGFLHRFIANRFLYREGSDGGRKSLPVVRISAIGIALGVVLILLSIFIVRGFKLEIRDRINGFVGHLKIFHPDNAHNQYTQPLLTPSALLGEMRAIVTPIDPKGVVYTFADQMGVIKTDSTYSGVIIHGVDSLYDAEFFKKYLLRGECPTFGSDEGSRILISSHVANYLDVDVGQTVMTYFFDGERLKVRKFDIAGVYRTGFKDYDENIAIGNIRDVRSVLDWSEEQSGGVEVKLSDDRLSDSVYDNLYDLLLQRVNTSGERYTMLTARDMNPAMYGWVDLLDTNVRLILILMITVAAMTMITGVIVIILERVRAIATLKALGQRNHSLRQVFHHVAVRILLKGLLWGNAVALLIGALQSHFKLVKLDAAQYYIDYVPIHISIWAILLTNLITIVALYLIIFVPTMIIANIRPAEGVRFD